MKGKGGRTNDCQSLQQQCPSRSFESDLFNHSDEPVKNLNNSFTNCILLNVQNVFSRDISAILAVFNVNVLVSKCFIYAKYHGCTT